MLPKVLAVQEFQTFLTDSKEAPLHSARCFDRFQSFKELGGRCKRVLHSSEDKLSNVRASPQSNLPVCEDREKKQATQQKNEMTLVLALWTEAREAAVPAA